MYKLIAKYGVIHKVDIMDNLVETLHQYQQKLELLETCGFEVLENPLSIRSDVVDYPISVWVEEYRTLLEEGAPWAQEYTESGRLTGSLCAEPEYTAPGVVAPGWRYVGDQTEDQFWDQFEKEE